MKFLSSLLLFLALAGCGNDPSPVTPSQFFQKRAQEACAGVSTACLVTVATCTTARVTEYTAEYQTATSSFRDFIPSNAEVCLAEVKALYRKVNQGTVAVEKVDYLRMEAACANVYRGISPVNGPCQSHSDCLGDLICDKGFCGSARLVGEGAGCANIGEYCPPGWYCGKSTGVWVCTAKGGAQNDCAITPCIESLRCASGSCVARLGTGEPCTDDGDCASEFCEPYAQKCADDIRFANGSAVCVAMGGS